MTTLSYITIGILVAWGVFYTYFMLRMNKKK